MIARIGLVVLLSLAIGFGIGCIPVLKDNLHWNVWVIVPVSGMLLGGALAWLQFWACALLRSAFTQKVAGVLSLAAVASFLATDLGNYSSSSVEVSGVPNVQDGTYPIRQLISFTDYMKLRLGSSELSHGSEKLLELGTTATTLGFVVDLAGAGIAAFGTFLSLSFLHPSCQRCSRPKKKTRAGVIRPPSRKEVLQGILRDVTTLAREGRHAELVQRLKELAKGEQNSRARLKIGITQFECPQCGEKTIVGRIFMQDDQKRWREDEKLRFQSTSARASAAG